MNSNPKFKLSFGDTDNDIYVVPDGVHFVLDITSVGTTIRLYSNNATSMKLLNVYKTHQSISSIGLFINGVLFSQYFGDEISVSYKIDAKDNTEILEFFISKNQGGNEVNG